MAVYHPIVFHMVNSHEKDHLLQELRCLCHDLLFQNLDIYSAYEILITILMEGMNIFTDGLNTISSYDVENDHILAFDPWFYSLGINIKCETVDNNYNNERSAVQNGTADLSHILPQTQGKTGRH